MPDSVVRRMADPEEKELSDLLTLRAMIQNEGITPFVKQALGGRNEKQIEKRIDELQKKLGRK